MIKLHQLLPNVAFFAAITLIYFGFVSWANTLASILVVSFVYFDKITEQNALKYAIKNFGSFLLFIPLGYFQLSILPLGVLVFLSGFFVAYFRLTNFRGNIPKIIL